MTNEELDAQITEKIMDNEAHPYSTDVLYAVKLLNRLRDKGFFWRLDSYGHTEAICTLQNIDRKTYSVKAATIPLAICETALRTL